MVRKLDRSIHTRPPHNVSVPAYDRQSLRPGILHIGVGNFHRAHQAVYLDRLFDLGLDHDWAILGAGTRSNDAHMRQKLEAQDWLTTVVELDPSGLNARICGSMVDYVEIDPEKIIAVLTRPDIRIVSLTITEGGYYVDPQSGGLDLAHADIRRDIDNPDDPQTVFGMLITGLQRRREAGLAPFTIMSCDNLPGNGHVTQNAVVGLAAAMSPDLGNWISHNVAFPNGMVDCITPATSDRERRLVRETFDLDDAVPVVCEPFRQWVLEDTFPAGRPALEKVGVQFVNDVAPYELMKLRILNGGHAVIAYPAALLGHEFVHEAMADRRVRSFLDKVVHEEIMPTVPAIDGVDFADYYDSVAARFSNPAVGDTVARICLDGSNRQPKFVLPAIAERLSGEQPIEGLALEVALWCRYCTGLDEAGNKITVDDENATVLREYALRAKEEPSAFLELHAVFGPLAKDDAFRAAFAIALERVWSQGTEAALRHYTG